MTGVLPILVSQAGLGSPKSIEDPTIRHELTDIPEYVGMTVPLAIQTWMRVSTIIEEVAHENNAVFVDGYNAVPHNIKYMRDHVHLQDAGLEALAKEITRTLLNDSQFNELLSQVHQETTSASKLEE